MINHSTKYVFEQIDKNYSIPDEIKDLYELLKKYPNRLKFVKDHNGVKNVVFIATNDSSEIVYEYPYFALFTFNKSDLKQPLYTIIDYSPENIYKNTIAFLENTNETLYVSFGFNDCRITDEDYFNILYLMEDTKCNVIDAIVTIRRFPEWYEKEADYPFYLNKASELIKQMEDKERYYLLNEKHKILVELTKVVENDDENFFYVLSNKIKAINSQLSEYKK